MRSLTLWCLFGILSLSTLVSSAATIHLDCTTPGGLNSYCDIYTGSLTGLLPVNQSGTWNVGAYQSGAWTVNVNNTSPIPVSVSGVTLDLSGTTLEVDITPDAFSGMWNYYVRPTASDTSVGGVLADIRWMLMFSLLFQFVSLFRSI